MGAFISFPSRFLNIDILLEIGSFYNVGLDLDELSANATETDPHKLSKELIQRVADYLQDEIYDNNFYFNAVTGIYTCSSDNLYEDSRLHRLEKLFETLEVPYDSGSADGLSEMHYRPGLEKPKHLLKAHPSIAGRFIEIEKILTILDSTATDDASVLKATIMKNLEKCSTPSLEDFANNRELMLKHSGLNRLRVIS